MEQTKALQAQSCAAKPPDRFVEGPKTNLVTWLYSVEEYFRAKGLLENSWATMVVTFLSESALTKVRRANIEETSSNYFELRKNLMVLL